MAAVLLEAGTRLLHIGPHKTGTTAVQGAFHVEAAVRAALGAFMAGGAGGQAIEEIMRDVDTRSLAKVLARRCRQRARRALPR